MCVQTEPLSGGRPGDRCGVSLGSSMWVSTPPTAAISFRQNGLSSSQRPDPNQCTPGTKQQYRQYPNPSLRPEPVQIQTCVWDWLLHSRLVTSWWRCGVWIEPHTGCHAPPEETTQSTPRLEIRGPKGRIQGQDPGLGSKDEPEEKDPGE